MESGGPIAHRPCVGPSALWGGGARCQHRMQGSEAHHVTHTHGHTHMQTHTDLSSELVGKCSAMSLRSSPESLPSSCCCADNAASDSTRDRLDGRDDTDTRDNGDADTREWGEPERGEPMSSCGKPVCACGYGMGVIVGDAVPPDRGVSLSNAPNTVPITAHKQGHKQVSR